MTTPSPTPAGRLAIGEQRKEEEREESLDRQSSSSPWRVSWSEGGGGGEEGGGGGGEEVDSWTEGGGGGEEVDSETASSLIITAGGPVGVHKKTNLELLLSGNKYCDAIHNDSRSKVIKIRD